MPIKSLTRLPGVVIFGMVALTGATLAQELPQPLVYLGEYRVKPEKIHQFESVMKDFVREMKKYGMAYSFRMYSSENHVYYSVNEFENYAMLDRFNTDWQEVEGRIGAETMDRYHEAEFGAIESFKGTLLRFRPGASLTPSGGLLADEKIRFVDWELCYIDPSRREEWSSLQRDWDDLYKKGKVKMPFLTFTGDIGYEMPVWVYVRSVAEDARKIESTHELLQSTALHEEGASPIRRVEQRHTTYRRDLSYLPERE